MKRIAKWGTFLIAAVFAGGIVGANLPFNEVQRVTESSIIGQQKQISKPAHGRGYKPAPPDVTAKLHADALKRHGFRVMALPKVSAPSFDASTAPGFGVMPTSDQGSCGDCFGDSVARGTAPTALGKLGILPFTTDGWLSSQFGLDCGAFQGGCGGGDEAQVFEYIRTNGFPLEKDYGPYTASPGRCKDITGMKLYKIADWGYCKNDQGQGIASTDDMKKCIAQWGRISVAFDASECDSYSGGTMTGNGRSVDHAVNCDGWDDNHDNGNGTKGAFIGQNQWGKTWGITINGIPGRFWIAYGGADSWGTEAIWCSAGSLPPPPQPPPPFIPPLKLYEGTTIVGNPAGYLSLESADKAAQTLAKQDNAVVTVVDSAGKLIETVNPPPPPPPPPWGTATITIPDQSITIPGSQYNFGLFGRRVGTTPSITFTVPGGTYTGPVVPAQKK